MRQKSSVENLVNYHFRVNNLHIQQKKRRKASQCSYGDIMSQMQRVYEVNKFEQQGAKKIIFTACHSGKLKPKTFWLAELILQFSCYLNCSKSITCLSGNLKTEFTSPIAKSTSPGLSDTTFFAR